MRGGNINHADRCVRLVRPGPKTRWAPGDGQTEWCPIVGRVGAPSLVERLISICHVPPSRPGVGDWHDFRRSSVPHPHRWRVNTARRAVVPEWTV